MSMPIRLMEWEIKVSKLCNLRCKYCYEFDELGDPRRISIDGWRCILKSVRWYQEEFELNVSFDLVPGVRVTTSGRETEEQVRANLERILADGWRTQISTVIAGHNAARLPEIYDRLKKLSRDSKGQLYLMFIPFYP